MVTVIHLLAVLEDEVQVGEVLLANLKAQKEAILDWDSAALLLQVEEKERLVQQLAALEQKRQDIVRQLLREHGSPGADGAAALRKLLADLPPTPQRATLAHLQQRAKHVYTHLRAGEKQLTALMGMLLTHIGEALSTVTKPSAMPTYGEKGVLTSSRPEPGLVQGKV
jgi:Mg2+ and Co2+ transporter CorA